jgi:hypothetical protein
MTFFCRTALLTTSLFSASCISAAAQATAVLPAEVAIPRSVRHQITSKMNGLKYKLSVFLPRGYETGTDRYPILYVASGVTFGPDFAEMTRFLTAKNDNL